jgi:hypothetical protein
MQILDLIFRLLPIVERLAGAWIESDNLKRKAEIERLKNKVAKLEDQLRIKKASAQAALEARKRRENEKEKMQNEKAD